MESNKRTQFTFYESFFQAIKEIGDKDLQVKMYEAICNYSLYNIEPNFTGILKMAWLLIKPNLEASRKKAEAGKKGGQNKQNYNAITGGEADKKQNKSKAEANSKQKDFCLQKNSSKKEIENEIEKEKEKDNIIYDVELNSSKDNKNFLKPSHTIPQKFEKISSLEIFKEWWEWWETGTDIEIETFCKENHITNDIKIEVYERIVDYCEKSGKTYDNYRKVYKQSLLNKKNGETNGQI